MTNMQEATAKLFQPANIRKLQEDEYWDAEHGLICCGACHTPRQTRQSLLGVEWMLDCLCRCQAKQRDLKTQEVRKQEYMEQIRRMKTEGLQDQYLRECTFSNDAGYNPEELGYARQYVAGWETMQQQSRGLLLWGSVGSGKSFIAGCIANALLEKGVPVLMTNFPRILNALTDLKHVDRNQYVDSLNKYSLLILDDLGAGRSTEFALEQMFHVVDSRYRSKKPMIVTTNITLTELKETQDLDLRRVYDRILERCIPLKVNNVNIRGQKAAHDMDETRGLLSASE